MKNGYIDVHHHIIPDAYREALAEFGVRKAVNGTTGNTAYAFYRAGLFRRLLLCQLLPGLFQFFALGPS